jgi:glutathione S-transferase
MALLLYDLAGADERRRFSPYCWRIHLALKHKGLPFETRPWRFTEKEALARSGGTTVPVLVDGERWTSDSWQIAEALDAQYADRPALFDGAAGWQHARLTKHWVEGALFPLLLRMLAQDIHDRIHEKDKAYFRASREKRFGMTLEAYVAERDRAREQFRQALTPLRRVLAEQPFVCGKAPAFADYIAFGALQWARCVSPYPVLAEDDAVVPWRERMLDLYGGYARSFPAG